MSHVRLLAQRSAVAGFSVLCCLMVAGFTPQKTQNPSNAVTAGDSEPRAGEDSQSTVKQPTDRSKDDVGVDLDAKLKAKKKKEERKPNLEIRNAQTAPSDTIAYFKHNHWTFFQLDLIANNSDETVEVRTGFESLLDTPHSIHYRRLVHLLKEQNRYARLPVFLPEGRKGKFVELGLYRPGGVLEIQPPGLNREPCTVLGPEQFLIVTLSLTPDNYRFLNNMQCVVPGSEADDNEPIPQRRYFWLVSQFHPTRPMVADTVLGWSTTSYVVWDDLDPSLLSKRQQDAMIDWLHLGGQLIVSGGSAATRLEQSFLSEYLPADVVGSAQMEDLTELSTRYSTARSIQHLQAQIKPINILPGKPVYMARLAPRPESEPLQPKDKIGDLPLVVERRVGRGRVVMAAFSLYQPEFVQGWKDGYDTFWRDRLFRIDETLPVATFQMGSTEARTYVRLPARKLSQFRLLSRDLGVTSRRSRPAMPEKKTEDDLIPGATMPDSSLRDDRERESVADWLDGTPVTNAARQALLAATGIKIPPPNFVLTTSLAYLIALVPLNWFVCRFGFRRPELAWLITPGIILAFCIAIVQLARVNVGYDSTSQEIDVVEMFAGYPRGHVSRYTCLYSGSRERCEFRYEDLAALALPMSIGEVQRGHTIERLALDWDMTEGVPVALGRYEVHPRSIGMVRAEEMRSFSGPFRVQRGSGPSQWIIENQSEWELWDCQLITADGKIPIGDIFPGNRIEISMTGDIHRTANSEPSMYNVHRSIEIDGDGTSRSTVTELSDLSQTTLLDLFEHDSLGLGLRESVERPRLVGWAPRAVPGQEIHPTQDRSVGFTVFVVHL